jgi:hypothetical protein
VDQHAPPVDLDLADIHRGELRNAAARGVERLEDGPVPETAEIVADDSQEILDLFSEEKTGKLARALETADLRRRGGLYDAVLDQEAEETLQGGEHPVDARP